MDLRNFRSFIFDSGLDVWTCIDMAISVASADHQTELKNRRDGIVQKLYAPAFSNSCQKCDGHFFVGGSCDGREAEGIEEKGDVGSGCDIESEKMVIRCQEEDEDDDEKQREVVEIKNLLYYQNQSEWELIELLKKLMAMNITFKLLKETDIGRYVTRLRKHSSDEVRRLVKILVRKWKETVDEWVRLSTPEKEFTKFNDDQANHIQSALPKAGVILPGHAQNSTAPHCSTPPKASPNEPESLAFSAAKRFHGSQNHQESQNTKKQRLTAQEVVFDKMPKTKKEATVASNVTVKYW